MASDLVRLAALNWATLADLVRAGIELGLARMRLRSRDLRTLVAADLVAPVKLNPCQVRLVERIAFAIPRVANRLPWRADCLVQALAAERWLAREGVATRMTLGVPRDKRTVFEAHAWLSAGDLIVTGGDVSGYVPLVKP